MNRNTQLCFRIHLPKNALLQRITDIINGLQQLGDFILENNNKSLVIWLRDDKSLKDVKKALMKMKFEDYYCEEITYEDISAVSTPDLLTTWFIEHYKEIQIKWIEQDRQAELKQMNDNINKAREYLEQRIKENIKKESEEDRLS